MYLLSESLGTFNELIGIPLEIDSTVSLFVARPRIKNIHLDKKIITLSMIGDFENHS